MKKRTAGMISAASMLLLSAAGCSGVSKTVSVAEPTTAGITPESVIFDWQKAYEEKLSQFKSSPDNSADSMFDLFDLTGDGSPELIISPSTAAEAECRIYTFSGGNALTLGECGVKGVLEYYPEIRTLGKKYEGKTFEITEFMGIEDNEIYTKGKFYNNLNALSSGAKITYEIDNKTVNVSEYNKRISEFTNYDFLTVGRKYAVSNDCINYALHYSESWGAVLNDIQKDLLKDVLKGYMSSAVSDAAFELCDLNGDDLPELIYSECADNSAMCHVFKLNGNKTEEVQTLASLKGSIFFDIEKKVFFEPEYSNHLQPQTLDGGTANGYTRSDSVMECGRKYLLSDDSLVKAFR